MDFYTHIDLFQEENFHSFCNFFYTSLGNLQTKAENKNKHVFSTFVLGSQSLS
jgi:hypothetical protein